MSGKIRPFQKRKHQSKDGSGNTQEEGVTKKEEGQGNKYHDGDETENHWISSLYKGLFQNEEEQQQQGIEGQ